jgi:hypothetical protein
MLIAPNLNFWYVLFPWGLLMWWIKINIHKFLGIDYSASVSDQLRLHQRWQTYAVGADFSKEIRKRGPIAPQLPSINPISSHPVKQLKQSEACLNLNIFSPGKTKIYRLWFGYMEVVFKVVVHHCQNTTAQN